MWLEVREDNDMALRLYERMGFSIVLKKKGLPWKTQARKVLMRKILTYGDNNDGQSSVVTKKTVSHESDDGKHAQLSGDSGRTFIWQEEQK